METEITIDRIEGRNRPFYNSGGRFPYCTFSNEENILTEHQKEIGDLINSINQLYLTLPTATEKYTFISDAHATFSRIDRMLGHKIILMHYEKLK